MAWDTSGSTVLSPEAFCFIVDLDNRQSPERLHFQLMPDTITESKSANYEEIPIIGRSLPLLGYTNSTARQVSLSLSFAALKRDGEYSPEGILKKVRWLESKVYPHYDGIWVLPPHRLLLVIGKALAMTCVMSSCTTTHMKPWNVAGVDARPFRVQVDCSFIEWGENDDQYGHPHGHDQAISGENQPFQSGEGDVFYDIPFTL